MNESLFIPQIVGVVLAGGQSRRFGGGDKARQLLAGRPLLRHVIDRLRPQVGTLVLSANGELARFSEFGLPVVGDRVAFSQGPLAGIDAAMGWTRANRPGARWLLSAPADAPFLPDDLARRLFGALEATGSSVAVARSHGRLHPVFALWALRLGPDLARLLDEGGREPDDRRVDSFIYAQGREGEGWVAVDWPAPGVEPPAAKSRLETANDAKEDVGGDPFFNINTRAAFERAVAFLERDKRPPSRPARQN